MRKASNDGASLGINVETSCAAILRGDQLKVDDFRTPAQMRGYLMAAPESYEEGQKSYEEAGRWLARQYLLLLDQGVSEKLWDKVEEKFRGKPLDFTGFMVGWAENAARYVVGLPGKPNPALLQIQVSEE